jgi:flagellar biosynthesis anti-sigma factor FlgM
MRIDANSPAASLLAADWNKSPAAQSSSGARGANQDRATFSPASKLVQSLTARALQTPAVRQDRVEALRQSVSSGAYPLDAGKTAAAIVASGEG